MNKTKVANTLALATGILWVLCSALVLIFPDFSLSVTEWWMHGLNINAMSNWNLTVTNFVFGGIALIASAWGSGWVFAWSWEFTSKK